MIYMDTARLADDIRREQAAEHDAELRKLSDLAFIFLSATSGDTGQAERLLDNFIGLLFEGGYLQTWRYRILLGKIREGL